MKYKCEDNKIKIIPQNKYERSYLEQFVFEMAYGNYERKNEKDVLKALIIPRRTHINNE